MRFQSPERLQRNLENMQQTLERERGLAAAAEKRMRELQARMDTATKVPWRGPLVQTCFSRPPYRSREGRDSQPPPPPPPCRWRKRSAKPWRPWRRQSRRWSARRRCGRLCPVLVSRQRCRREGALIRRLFALPCPTGVAEGQGRKGGCAEERERAAAPGLHHSAPPPAAGSRAGEDPAHRGAGRAASSCSCCTSMGFLLCLSLRLPFSLAVHRGSSSAKRPRPRWRRA